MKRKQWNVVGRGVILSWAPGCPAPDFFELRGLGRLFTGAKLLSPAQLTRCQQSNYKLPSLGNVPQDRVGEDLLLELRRHKPSALLIPR